jgi:hypothetical protein
MKAVSNVARIESDVREHVEGGLRNRGRKQINGDAKFARLNDK